MCHGIIKFYEMFCFIYTDFVSIDSIVVCTHRSHKLKFPFTLPVSKSSICFNLLTHPHWAHEDS